ncbi:MAG: NUDIX domain-containing protein, partial [Intestinibacillus sp.]
TRGEAMRREAALKKLPRAEKQALADGLARSEDEFLTVYDANRQPCGVLPRALVHRCGLLHFVAHLHVFQTRDGVPGVWLQQRSFDKKAAPGAYDWAATGHVDPGENPLDAACREAFEECGLSLPAESLRPAGEQRVKTVYAPDFVDDELAGSFAYVAEKPPAFSPGPEVQRMVWTACDALAETLREGVPLPVTAADGTRECIPPAELSRGLAEWRQVCRALGRRV